MFINLRLSMKPSTNDVKLLLTILAEFYFNDDNLSQDCVLLITWTTFQTPTLRNFKVCLIHITKTTDIAQKYCLPDI